MRHFSIGLALFSLPLLAFAAQGHVHGEARLEIAVEANDVFVHFQAPLDALIGFERRPRTPAEQLTVSTMKSRLQAGEQVFKLPPEARCQLVSTQIESPAFTQQGHTQHLDLDAEYRWQCTNPSALRSIETRLFSEFNRIKRIKLEFVGPPGQKSVVLTPKKTVFDW